MDVDKVIRYLRICQYAYKYTHDALFDYYIAKLAEQLKGVIIGDVDQDALIHSFM